MTDLPRGLYEDLVTEALAKQLDDLDARKVPRTDELRPADAADRIARHLGDLLRRALSDVEDAEGVAHAITLARGVIALVEERRPGAGLLPESPIDPGAVLRAL